MVESGLTDPEVTKTVANIQLTQGATLLLLSNITVEVTGKLSASEFSTIIIQNLKEVVADIVLTNSKLFFDPPPVGVQQQNNIGKRQRSVTTRSKVAGSVSATTSSTTTR